MEGRSDSLGLTLPEQQTLLKIAQHPALLPFVLVAGVTGLDAAAECCASRQVPEAVAEKLACASYGVDDLPDSQTLHMLFVGIRWRHKLCAAIKKQRPIPPQVRIAKSLGVTRREIRDGIRALARYGWYDPQVAVRREVNAFVGGDPRADQGA